MPRNKKLEQAINESGLKKKFICEKIGIHPGYYTDFMRNPEKMSLEQAMILSDLLHMNLSDIDFSR